MRISVTDQDTDALRSRIEELEAALAATVSEVDAGGEVVERPYRLMVEQMAEGALTLEEVTGRILYSNAAFAGMLGHPVERLIGRPFGELVDDAHADAARELAQGLRPMRRDLCLVRSDDEAVSVAA
jgi:PAS domain-containing protein